MSGLAKKNIQLLLDGGIDTKTNPKLVRSPALLELENMYQLRTGELRVRNGCSLLTNSDSSTTIPDNLTASPSGVLLGANITQPSGSQRTMSRYRASGTGATQGWDEAPAGTVVTAAQFPRATATVRGVGGIAENIGGTTTGGSLADCLEPDVCIANGVVLTTWIESGLTGSIYVEISMASGQRLRSQIISIFSGGGSRSAKCAAGGSAYLCAFYVDSTTLKSAVYNTTGQLLATYNVAAAGVLFAAPTFDVKPIAGGNTIAVAFNAIAGGVTCCVFDPATGGVSSSVTTAGTDASLAMAWLENVDFPTALFLVAAGATNGVTEQVMSLAMVVSGTTTVDASAAAKTTRQLTGYGFDGPGNGYVVIYEVPNATTYFSTTKRGVRTSGVITLDTLAPSFCIASRAFKYNGAYYYVGAYDSTVQPSYSLLELGPLTAPYPVVQCQIMPGYGGGRRANTCSLSSVYANGTSFELALARRQKISTAAGTVQPIRGITLVDISFVARLMRPRELGGTVFFPGGVVIRDDGRTASAAVFPCYLESPTIVSAPVGAMTAGGTYGYILVIKSIDATGRVTRSAGSVSTTVTLGGSDGQVTLTCQIPQIPHPETGLKLLYQTAEVYRQGPAAALASGYNKVGEFVAVTGPSLTVTFNDALSDAAAGLGELLYSTGNVLENFCPPSCNLMEVNGGRLWIVNAEYPAELWYSKEYKPGVGIGFNPLLTMRLEGDGRGPITALASLDGRLIAFKDSSIWVVSGDGPNDNGQGQFNQPQAISRSTGTVLPGSVVSTPDGIMFQSAKGIYLLDRGLGLTYVGAPVESYTLAAPVIDACQIDNQTQVRFVMASGRCLVWDYYQKRWYTFLFPVAGGSIWACAYSSTLGFVYTTSNATAYREIPGQTTDEGGVTIVPRVSFPHLDMAGLAGYQRCYGLDLTFDVVGNHTIAVDAEFDYSGAVTGTPRTKALTTATPTAQVEYNPPEGRAKCTSMRPVVTISGAAAAGSFRLTGATLRVGVKQGSNVPATSRLT